MHTFDLHFCKYNLQFSTFQEARKKAEEDGKQKSIKSDSFHIKNVNEITLFENFIDHKSIEMNDSIKNANEARLSWAGIHGIPQIIYMQAIIHAH